MSGKTWNKTKNCPHKTEETNNKKKDPGQLQ